MTRNLLDRKKGGEGVSNKFFHQGDNGKIPQTGIKEGAHSMPGPERRRRGQKAAFNVKQKGGKLKELRKKRQEVIHAGREKDYAIVNDKAWTLGG